MAEADRLKIVKSLLRLGAYLQREGDRLLSSFSLTQQQFVVLKEIQEKGPLSQKQICSGLLFEKSNVSKIVKKLEAAGLIQRTVSPGDGRVDLVSVTRKGEKVIGLCMARLDVWNRRWLRPLPAVDVDNTVAMLEQLERLQRAG